MITAMMRKKGWAGTMGKNKIVIAAAAVVLLMIGGISVMSVKKASENGRPDGTIDFSIGGRAELRNTIEIPLDKVKSLQMVYGSKNIKVYQAKDDAILIKEYLYSNKKEAQAEVTYGEEGRVSVKGGSVRNFIFFGFGLGGGERIEVYIPEKGLRELSIETGSGNITSEAGYYQEDGALTVKAGSGNIKWTGADTGNIFFQTGSGNMTVEHIKGTSQLHAGSGNIRAQEIEGEVQAGTGSGGITLEEFAGSGRVKAGSGNIKLEAAQIKGDLELETNSGNINLELPEDIPDCYFKINTGSGNIHTDFDGQLSFNKKGNSAEGTLGEEPSCHIRAKAGSGNVRIAK